MAGAGYKLFNTGDVLTAAQVNTYLQEQVVMRFANATARTTALSGVLAEGMVSYLDDTNTLEVYNGSAWVGATGDITEVQAGTGISVSSGTGPVPVVTNTVATAFDAKGDLIVGTGADTFSKLAVGTNDYVLTAASGEATGMKWAAAGAGKVVQIVYGSTTTGVGSATTTFADTNLSATITPTSASNKVLIMFNQNGCHKYNANTRLQIRLVRGSTTILNSESFAGNNDGTGGNAFGSSSAVYLDSPATTSATTYKTQFANQAGAGTVYVNDTTSPGSTSTMILMEVTP